MRFGPLVALALSSSVRHGAVQLKSDPIRRGQRGQQGRAKALQNIMDRGGAATLDEVGELSGLGLGTPIRAIIRSAIKRLTLYCSFTMCTQ